MTQQSGGSGADPVGDFQRWLIRSGARGMSRELRDRLRTTLGMNGGTGDVWEAATAGPPQEAPECAWCPLCRAARMVRESRPGVGSQLSAAGDALAAVVQEMAAAVDAAFARQSAASPPGAPGEQPPGEADGQSPPGAPGEQPPGEADGQSPPGEPPTSPSEESRHEPDDRG